ncbi:FAD-dependent oxidoreductase [Brevibacterium zhoupengii]|uniref:FAD-dependent oxidoreductase n=1 Tax=Brevibacterium zhoupengii TaxID=2898795 RepID=UPI001E592EB8|nr:FAD-dependent oxidoreductase [Brevibacterium zhoupengii]
MRYLNHANAEAAQSRNFDVVIVGSGASSLTAAATAADAGLSVIVLEKSELLGGTSAVSGGMLWIVDNDFAREAGMNDSRGEGRIYADAVARGRGRPELLDAALDHGVDMLRFVVAELGLKFLFLDDFPDYRQDLPGAAKGGRTIEPDLYNARADLGTLFDHIRTDGRLPFSMQEYERWGAFTRFPWQELQERKDQGYAAKGHALVSMLVAACVSRGVVFAVEARVERLTTDNGRITGIVLDDGAAFNAGTGVMLGTGGFEWDHELADSLLASRLYTKCSPPTNTGDGLKMAQRIGATIRGTREAWWAPMSVTGGLRDGQPIGTLLRFERQGPGSIMINRHGERFANESQNYNDLARALHSWDSASNQTLNTPAHVVFDQSYLKRYGILEHRAGQPLPDYLIAGDSLEELAQKIDVPAENLTATIERFNPMAERGIDEDFGRGESAYDRYWGDDDNPWPNPSLAPLQHGPYYAMEVVNGAFGTCGGVATDGNGQVLDPDHLPIPGLFAAGNVTESPYAAGYPGAGATLGPLMTMAYLAGRTMTGQSAEFSVADRAPASAAVVDA